MWYEITLSELFSKLHKVYLYSSTRRLKIRCVIILFTGTIRLGGGSNKREGRVEVYHDDKWGTVCDDAWDINDAQVVCRSLGFANATEAKSRAYFGEGSGEVWLDDVACTGMEQHLQNCSHRGWGEEDCGHDEDAGVICSGKAHFDRQVFEWVEKV